MTHSNTSTTLMTATSTIPENDNDGPSTPTHQVSFSFTSPFSFSFIHSLYSLRVDNYRTTTTSVDVQPLPALALTVAAIPSPRLSVDNHSCTPSSASTAMSCPIPSIDDYRWYHQRLCHPQASIYDGDGWSPPDPELRPQPLPTTPLESIPTVMSTLNIVAVPKTHTYFSTFRTYCIT